MSRPRVLVTGADGFIGSHLTEALVRRGYEVKAFVLYNSFNSWGWLDHCSPDIRGHFEVFAGDIRDPNGVRVAMKDCDAVLHLAALIARISEALSASFQSQLASVESLYGYGGASQRIVDLLIKTNPSPTKTFFDIDHDY